MSEGLRFRVLFYLTKFTIRDIFRVFFHKNSTMQPQIIKDFDENRPVDFAFWEGGPCSGKTAGIKRAKKIFEANGVIALAVPEAATILKSGGLHPRDFLDVDYQMAIINTQLANEEVFRDMGLILQKKFQKRVVVLCDRGLLTGSAYMKSDDHVTDFAEKVLNPMGISIESIRNRYRGGVHLVTAADGAEEFYSLENNEARDETPEFARWLDPRSQAAWRDHWDVHVFRNRTPDDRPVPFDEKIDAAVARIMEIFGVPLSS